jgi:peptide deformylase
MILQVLKDTHPKLKKVAVPSDPTKAHHKTLARRLVETMNAHEALGIAANQVFPGELVRIIAVNTSKYKGAMFNPEIVKSSELCTTLKEGCLSTKERVDMTRPFSITVKFFDISNQEKTLEFIDLDSHIVQHEIDHLNGIVISDFI